MPKRHPESCARFSRPFILLTIFALRAVMNRTAPAAAAFKEAIDLKLLTPVQRNLFTGEPEPIHVDIDHAIPEDETTKPGDRLFDRGNCLSDRRHIFNFTGVAQSPKFANHTLNMLATDWRFSRIYRWRALRSTSSVVPTTPSRHRPAARESDRGHYWQTSRRRRSVRLAPCPTRRLRFEERRQTE